MPEQWECMRWKRQKGKVLIIQALGGLMLATPMSEACNVARVQEPRLTGTMLHRERPGGRLRETRIHPPSPVCMLCWRDGTDRTYAREVGLGGARARTGARVGARE